MSLSKTGYAPCGKTGAGNYGATLGKQNITYINPVRDRMLELVTSIPFLDKSSVFSIGDYGAADGACSIPFIRDLIVTLREKHGFGVQFQVIYEDLEISDFNSLFKRLTGTIPDPPSYLLELDNVYPLASGINFYKQCVPSDSMHFIMSIVAVQWLSRRVPCKDSTYIYLDGTQEEQETLNKQILTDWGTFLLHRSRELKQGGLLLVSATAEYVDDRGRRRFSLRTIITVLTKVWQSFQDSGKISSQEFTNTYFGLCMYSLEQLKSPFEDQNSNVYQSGLRLVSAEITIVPDVFYNAWKEKKEQTGVDDRQEFARNFLAAHRNWSHGTFLSGLSENRSQEEKEKIVDELYEAAEKTIGQMCPEQFKDDLVKAYVIMRKE